MSISQVADRLVLEGSIVGNVFPKTEKEILLPLSIKPEEQAIEVKGSIYARSIEVDGGDAIVYGPIASQGDVRVHSGSGKFQAQAGITTLSGFIIGEKSASDTQLVKDCSNCRALIKGDIMSNQSVVINDSLIFGSIKAVNCTLINSVVLGTIHCKENLSIEMSSIGGYFSQSVNFKGICTMFNALGESTERPMFLPYEDVTGQIFSSSIHFYPALRAHSGLRTSPDVASQHSMSLLYPEVDWINVRTTSDDLPTKSWVLSLGGRIADFRKLNDSTESFSELLRIGFEFSHYTPEAKHQEIEKIMPRLTPCEASVLKQICI